MGSYSESEKASQHREMPTNAVVVLLRSGRDQASSWARWTFRRETQHLGRNLRFKGTAKDSEQWSSPVKPLRSQNYVKPHNGRARVLLWAVLDRHCARRRR